MKASAKLHSLLIALGSLSVAFTTASAQATYTWANSNVAATPTADLDWFTGGDNTQGTWIATAPVSGNLNTVQFFQNAVTALTNTATPSSQNVVLNHGGNAFQIGTLGLSGLASSTTNANLTMNLSGDALNFSAATGTINADARNATRTITYNVGHDLQLGTASSGSVLTIDGSGTSAFHFDGVISELQVGGGSLIKRGGATVSLSNAQSYTGTTTLIGGILNLRGATGSIASSAGITLNGGTLSLTNVNDTEGAINRVSNSAAITSNGGTINYNNTNGAFTYAETIGPVTMSSGQTNFALGTNIANTSGLQTLTVADLIRTGANNTASATFSAATTSPDDVRNQVASTLYNGASVSATPANQIIGPWATTGTLPGTQTDYARFDSAGRVLPANISSVAETSWVNSTTDSWTLNPGTNISLTGLRQTSALRFFGGSATLNLESFHLETGGILFSGANAMTISSTGTGVITTATGGGNLFLTAGQQNHTISAPIADNGGAVTVVVGNSAGRTLTLSSTASNYSGGTVINSGILSITNDANLGAAGGNIILNGGQLRASSANISSARSVMVDSAGGSIGTTGNNNFTTSGVLSGSGDLTFGPISGAGGQSLIFNSTLNTFTGGIFVPTNSPIISFNSLPDSSRNIVFNGAQGGTFTYGTGAVAPLVFNGRSFIFSQSVGGQSLSLNSSSPIPAASMTIHTPLIVNGTGTSNIVLVGTNTGVNTISGTIGDGPSGATSVRATSSFWTLSGNNTYTGITGPDNVTLTIRGKDALPTGSLISFDTGSGSAGAGGGRLSLFMNDSGVVNLGNQINVRTAQTSGGVTASWTINVGNNGGMTTGSTLVFGKLNFASITDTRAGGYLLNVTGSNGYNVRIGDVDMATNVGSGGNGAPTRGQGFNPTTASLEVTGTVRQVAGTPASPGAWAGTLVLSGSSSGNTVSGNILNPVDFGTNVNALPLTVSKLGTSEWTLSGTNSYTGGTNITNGKLTFSGANSLPTSGTVTVGSAGHFSLADGAARNQTVAALVLTSLANLSFDWTGTNTGDQLTSTADITPTAGSNFYVNLNRSGTPGGSVTLLTGGASSTLDQSNFFLINATDYTATLTKSPTTVVVDNYTAVAPLTTLYWQGNRVANTSTANIDNSWTLSNGSASNWSSSTTAYTATSLTPGSTANVIFANGQVGKSQQSTTLGTNVSINSLVIDDATAVSIGGSDSAALTLLSTLSTPGDAVGTPGSAITVTSNSNNTPSINARVILGEDQTWNIASGKTLTVGGAVSGESALTKADAGTLILNGTNTYTGDTTISAGTLRVGNNTGGTLGGGNYAGNIVNNGTLQLWSTANQTISGVISGSGNLQKAYGGSLTLTGNNTYTGRTLLQPQTTSGFTLNVSSFNSVNGGTPLMASSSLGAPTTLENGTIEFGNTSTQAAITINYTGPGETTDRVINFAMNGTGATKTLDASGTGLLKFTSTFTKSGSNSNDVTLQGAGNGEIVGGLNFVFRNFTKSGNGTWTLGNAVGNTGTTTINAGTLVMNGSQAAGGAVAVNGTSTLAGSGSIGGATTVAATANLSPGSASVGTLTFQNNLTISALAGGSGRMNFDLGPVASSDRIAVAGALDIGADALGFNDFNFTNAGGLTNGVYKLITSASRTGSLDATNLSGPIGGGIGTLQISDGGTGNDIELVVSGLSGGAPEIDVNQGGDIASGGSKSFGTVTIGSPTSLVFTINNTGSSVLNLSGSPRVAVSGTHAAEFTVTAQPAATVASGGGSTTFTVQFAPTATGLRSAVLTIANDDSNENPFIINISGTGQTPYQAWAGGAGFGADANNDGISNGLAFLLGASGPSAAVPPFTFTESNGNLILNFSMRNAAARGSATLSVQHSSDLGQADTWATALVPDANGGPTSGVTFTVTPGSPLNTVSATISSSEADDGKLFGRLKADE